MRLFVVMIGCLCFAIRADASSACGGLVGELLVGVQGLAVRSVSHVDAASAFDIVYLKHPDATEVALTCRFPRSSLDVDWRGGLPPAGYFQLIGRLGSIMTGISAEAISAAAAECQKRAIVAKYEMAELVSQGVKFECDSFTHDSGGTSMTIYKASA